MTTKQKFWLSIIGFLIILGALIRLWAPILAPFGIAAVLAYLANPIVNVLCRWRLSRLWASVLVFTIFVLVLFSIMLLMIPLLEHQIRLLISLVPKIVTYIQHTALPWLNQRFDMHLQLDLSSLQQVIVSNLGSTSGTVKSIIRALSRSGLAIAAFFTNLLLVPVVMFYLLRDWQQVLDGIQGLLPRKLEPLICKLCHQCNDVLGAFFRGQLLVMLALGIIYSIGLSLMGLQLGLIIGMMAGLLSIVPYLGFVVGIVAALVAAIFQFHSVGALVMVVVIFGIGQAIEGMALTPLLVGDKIGLHPVAVIFAILAGGQMFGFIGILLALPVAAVIMVLLRYGHERYLASDIYNQRELNS